VPLVIGATVVAATARVVLVSAVRLGSGPAIASAAVGVLA